MEDETLKAWKNFALQNFIPKALAFGALSNLINFVILSRPCIKSTTNIYLSIMAFTDTSFLLLIYLFSKQYHDDAYRQANEVYWSWFGLLHWFYTAFLYITVYVMLCLTVDRYAAVRNPARTKCGIAQAKNVVSMVLLCCFLFSISAAFEYQLKSEEFKSDELCNNNRSQMVDMSTIKLMPTVLSRRGDNETALNRVKRDGSGYNFNEDERTMSHRRLQRSLDNDVLFSGINSTADSTESSKLRHKTSHNPADVDHYVNNAERDNATSRVIPKRNHNTCSSHFTLVYPVESGLAKNKFYRAIFKSIASLLLMLPVGCMMAMSCLLTAVVLRVNKTRRCVADLPSIADHPGKTDILIRENKITSFVITLVVIFLICHTPNAVFSLYKYCWGSSRQTSVEETQIKNFILGFEISCQILMTINCCSKIFVYLSAYSEYWTSLKSLKNCFQRSSAPGEQIINTSKHLFPSTKADVESLLNYSLNKKRYATQIPPEARHYRHPISAQRTYKQCSSSNTPKGSITPRLSLTPSDAEGMEMYRRETNQISTQPQVERQLSTRSNKSFRALHLSPSQASLTRSKSLNIQSTMKHSPNCRLNKKF